MEAANTGLQPIGDALEAEFARQTAAGREFRAPPINTGLADLDGVLGGLPRGELTFVAARPSTGLTTFLLELAAGAAIGNGVLAVLISTTMSPAEISQRVIAARGKISGERVAERRLLPHEMARAKRALREMHEAPLLLDADPGSRAVEERAARAAEVNGLELIVVDAFEGWGNPPLDAARDAARALRQLAGDRSIAIVLGLVLPYDLRSASPRPPAPVDLLATPGLVERGDTVLAFSRPEIYEPYTDRPGIAQVDVCGGRRQRGSLEFCFLDRYPRVVNKAREHRVID